MKSIRPGPVDGACRAPASKSELQRAIAASFLAGGRSEISGHSFCEDSRAALGVVEALGASVRFAGGLLVIEGEGREPSWSVDCGESGLCLRMFAPIVALFAKEISLSARGSLLNRPVSMVEAGLKACGASCRSRNGFPPLTVLGPLKGGKVVLDGSLSSQHVSGFLMALPRVKDGSRVVVQNMQSAPYIRLTLAVMKAFGVSAEADFERGDFRVPGGQAYQPRRYFVEGDWSGAAFLLVAGAIAGKVTVKGLDSGSLQADRSILRVLRQCGAQVSDSPDSVSVSTGPLSAFDFDARDAPDLFPPLAVLACYCRGTSRIHGTHRLRHKESARAEALLDVLGRMGAKIQVKGNVLEIAGAELKGGRVDSHHDHRIAMAAAVAALGSQGGAEIIHPECVAKSYPGFFDDLAQLRKTGGRA